MFRNLLHTLRNYKLASIFNIVGLALAFFFFSLVLAHYSFETDFDTNISEQIYQLENQRDDGIWDANFSRPMARTILTSSYSSGEYGVYKQNGVSELSRIGFAAEQNSQTILLSTEQVTQDFINLFDFKFAYGSASALDNPIAVLIPLSVSQLLYGNGDPIGKPLYVPEFRGVPANSGLPFPTDITPVIGAVYYDFPENTRLTNSVYFNIPANQQIDDWSTCSYYCYLKFSSKAEAESFAENINRDYETLMHSHSIKEIRVRQVRSLYFSTQARNDAAPIGSRTLVNVLLFIGLLIIVIALSNFINFSLALAPLRAKALTVRKVLGGSQSALRRGMIAEAVFVSLLSCVIAIGLVYVLRSDIEKLLGHELDFTRYWGAIALTFAAAGVGGIISGIYPAIFATSFPAVKALSESFMLDRGARFMRKGLVALQFVISIALVSLSLFVVLQNRFVSAYELGFDKENVLEVKLSIGTALTQSEVFRAELLKNAAIEDVAFCQMQLITDGTKPNIGYFYNGHHSYIGWTGVSRGLPEMFDFQLVEGRFFRESDLAPVCVVNETAAKELAQYGDGEVLNSYIYDNAIPVEIIGIMKDVNYESLYKSVGPYAFWYAPTGSYRSMAPGNFVYVKVRGSDVTGAIRHIIEVSEVLNPGYPAQVDFLDNSVGRLYEQSRIQGLLVAILSLIAVVLSLIGVFGMSIFEARRLKKEIAVRKVFGAEDMEILSLFTKPMVLTVLVSAVFSVPLSFYGVSVWLKGFAYHIPVYWWVFAAAVLAVLVITCATVTYQNFKVARTNPTESFRN